MREKGKSHTFKLADAIILLFAFLSFSRIRFSVREQICFRTKTMAPTAEMYNTKFLQCCENGLAKEVVGYIQHGVDVNCVETVDGNTGLMLASRDNRVEVAEVLLSILQTDVNKVNKFGYSALMLAAQSGNLDILDLLPRREDINLDITNKAGRKAEECAKRKSRDLVTFKISAARERVGKKRKIEETGENGYSEAPLTKVDRNESDQSMFRTEASGPRSVEREGHSGNLTIRSILTARLENCLIDLGNTSDNVLLCMEMLSMAKKLQLQDLQNICKKSLIDHITTDTVFEVLTAVDDDLEMKEICLNFIVTNIDEMRVADGWKQNLRKWPDISIELIERL